MADTDTAVSPGVIRFGVATKAMERFTNSQTVSNFAGPAQYQPVQLNATGWVRSVDLLFTASVTSASAGAIVAGDGPFNLISQITLNDPTNKPIYTPITGYQLYLINKYLSNGGIKFGKFQGAYDPTVGIDYAYASTATVGTAKFWLSLDLEVDSNTGYGCIPNLDANASLTLQVTAAQYTAAFTGVGSSVATLKMDVYQNYWAPTGKTMGNAAVQDQPAGAGDYLFTSLQTATVSAQSEGLTQVLNLGGVQQGIIVVSRAANVRTAFTAGSNVGLVYDNVDMQASIPLETFQQRLRRNYGFIGTDRATSYAPITAGTFAGLDNGVLAWPFDLEMPSRDQWFRTRTGALQQVRLTPGASATQLEIISRTMQVGDPAAFYDA